MAVAGSGKVWPFNHVNYTSRVAVDTPTDRPKSVRNPCVIELFVALFVLSLCPFDISVGVWAFVIGLSQISFFFSYSLYLHFQNVSYTLRFQQNRSIFDNLGFLFGHMPWYLRLKGSLKTTCVSDDVITCTRRGSCHLSLLQWPGMDGQDKVFYRICLIIHLENLVPEINSNSTNVSLCIRVQFYILARVFEEH